MKPIKITHHLERTGAGRPAFVILMDDGKEYISTGPNFVEATARNTKGLTDDYYFTQEEMTKLLESKGLADEELIDGECMFQGCIILTEAGNYPNLGAAKGMYHGCGMLKATGDYPKLKIGYGMYEECARITETGNYPDLKDGRWMYHDCPCLIEPGDYPELKEGFSMYGYCTSLVKKGNYPKLLSSGFMYESCPLAEQEPSSDMGM